MNASGTRVLLVDDNRDLVDFLTIVLTGEGFLVTATTSAREAVEQFGLAPPVVALIDMHLPDAAGPELVRRFKADPHVAELGVVIMSACSGQEHRRMAFDAGCDAYLEKPFSVASVLETIKNLCAS